MGRVRVLGHVIDQEGVADASLPGRGLAHSLLAAAWELTGDAVLVVDAERRIVHCSDALLALLDRSRDEVVGRRCIDGLRCVNCEEGCQLFEQEVVCQRHAELIAKDGAVIHVVKNGRLLRDADGEIVFGVETIQDVSDLHAYTRRVESEAEQLDRDCTLLRAVADHTGEGLVTLDREGRITCLTAVAADLLGVGRETVRGGTIGDLLLDDGRLAEALEVVLASGGARELDDVTPRLRRGVGLRMVVRLAGIPGESGSILGVALALRAQRWRGEEIPSVHGIVGRAPATRRLVELVETLASSDATVLVTGESGTGKELVARGLHRAGPRAKAPFLAVNCATLTETLLESELFGHARGAFTGADRDKPGRLELCGDGTLLLDEVGCLPPNTQAKLLRVLEQREFHRLGGTRTLRLRARIVAATNADLAGLVRRGEFREDLYYRLRVVPLHVPPLRERRSDIRLLARHFAMELATAGPVAFDPAAERALEVHDWPGNVRELRNAIQYALATSGGHHVAPSDLPPEIRAAAATTGPAPDTPDDERGRIECALERARYNRTRAARALGMSRSTLWRRMRDLGIDG